MGHSLHAPCRRTALVNEENLFVAAGTRNFKGELLMPTTSTLGMFQQVYRAQCEPQSAVSCATHQPQPAVPRGRAVCVMQMAGSHLLRWEATAHR